MRIDMRSVERLETIWYDRGIFMGGDVPVRARSIAAVKFVQAVKSAGKKQELDRLLMDFWMQNCDEAAIPDLIHNVKELLNGNRRLLLMCNALLPEFMKFKMPDKAGSSQGYQGWRPRFSTAGVSTSGATLSEQGLPDEEGSEMEQENN